MSDDVTQFLQQVQQLQGRRADDDEARSRELEEKILQEKSERAARRAERARSISPQKSSPANTPPPPSHRASQSSNRLSLASSLALESPVPRRDAPEEAMDQPLNRHSASPTKGETEPAEPAEQWRRPSDASPGLPSPGSRPLSWQRRPASRSPDKSWSRPLSILATQNAARSSIADSPEPASASEDVMSRDRISQSLSGKDPAWFRQTRDRGLSSPAYRRSQVEDSNRSDMSSGPSQLPGMSSSSGAEGPGPAAAPLRRSKTGGSILDMSSSPRLDPPADIEPRSLERSPTRADGRMSPTRADGRMSPTRADGRMSPNRSASPTKGMGGFVQSAMMKRSDSVKRWSVASPPGLARADSVASNRGSISERAGIASQPNSRSRPASIIRDGSTTPTRRRHGSDEGGDVEPANVADPTPDTMSNLSTAAPPAQADEKTTPPTSPTKTMDPRRWSPTKSSWLENALNKPEIPKPKPAAPPSNQPAWMVELNKAKAQKANNPDGAIKAEPPSHRHEVKLGGLMRPSTSGVAKDGAAIVDSPSIATTSSSERPAPGLKIPLDKPASTSSTSPNLPARRPVGGSGAGLESRAKPETPTKLDFRGNLKPRQPPPTGDSQKGDDNELASVFGKLRRTKTQNYVAPDELKNNILRGKASLNITGGPKKTERKDEFKEAILQKKEEFKKAQAEGTGVKTTSNIPAEEPIPEGLAKRSELGRSATHSRGASVSSDTTRAASTIPSNRESLATDITGPESAITSPSFKSAQTPTTDTVLEIPPTEPAVRESPAPSPVPATRETRAPSRGAGRVGGSLADRFNPALAGILARGPPGASPNKAPEPAAQTTSDQSSGASGGPQLTHATKNRARGPRRKAPSSAAPASAAPKSSTRTPAPAEPPTPVVNEHSKQITSSEMASSVTSTTAERPSRIQLVDSTKPDPADQIRLVDSSSSMSPSYSQPYSPYTRRKENENNATPAPGQIKLVDSSAMREVYAAATPTRERGGSVSSLSFAGTPTREARGSYSSGSSMKGSIASQVAASAVQRSSPLTPRSPEEKKEVPVPEASSPKKLDMKRRSRFFEEAQPSEPAKDPAKRQSRPSSPVKAPEQSETAGTAQPSSRPLPQPPQATPGSPARALPQPPSPTKDLPGTPSGSRMSIQNAAAKFNNGAGSPTKEAAPGFDSPQGFRSRSRSPTKVDRPPPLSPTKSPARVSSPLRSPTRQNVETSQLLTDFFGPKRPRREYHTDAAEILMQRPPTAQDIKTASTQRLQIFGDGKMVPVPTHNDRVLFEREMYVCSHVFTAGSSRKVTEVYFWVGDEVPESAERGAEAIAAKEAKAVGGKLIVLHQGKETAEFLVALGGVVITLRGSSNKYDSLAPNMLCGRRTLGCVAFDEVDFSPASLCSGFPYLIAQQGKCHLWKGRGSDGEELDCARLVGMDLSLTGALEEVGDGEEPAGFWDVFGGGEKGVSADHWRLKPGYGKYCCRLFCSEAEKKQQITEIAPYAQTDLSPSKIYVLDAFFEMYIIVGADASAQYASFRNALDFAQEYAILASGVEDRPFIPVSTVVLEGVPRDLKSVFRKWREGRGPTRVAGGLRRGGSLRVVPLTQALQALAE